MSVQRLTAAIGVVFLLAAGGLCAQAAVISDASYFAFLPHTFINFETDGAGNPISLGNGQRQSMPQNAYASQGFTISREVSWVNDGGSDFDYAQSQGGSLPIMMIPTTFNDWTDWAITFSSPVSAFGFFVIDLNTVTPNPSFTARDGSNTPLETVTFGPAFRDGSRGVADYGFMGIAAVGDVIGSIAFTGVNYELDNFYFSRVIPEPSTLIIWSVLGALGIAWWRRRKAT